MKSDMPLVSVVMCEHNTPIDFLIFAVQSMLDQTYKNFEIIFVDDCTITPYQQNSVFKDPRIHIIKNPTNYGLAKSRNIGIKQSKGKYICIMDTDDFSHSTRIEKQVLFLETHADVVACGSWFNMFGKKNKTVKRSIDDNDYYRCCLLFQNSPTIINPSVMIRKDVLVNNNIVLDENLTSAEDYQLWVDLSRYGIITNIKEVLLDYRIRDGQMSEVYRTEDLSDNGWRIFKKQLMSVGIKESDLDEKFLRKNYLSKETDPIKYFAFLQSIVKANNLTHFYDEEKLKIRIREQWVQKIYSIKNPFLLIKVAFFLPSKERRFLIKSEIKRLFIGISND